MRKGTATTLAIVVLVILAVIGIGLPYYAGLQTEKQFRATLEAAIQDSPLSLKEFSYQRGVYSARASSPLELTTGKDAMLIPVEHDIQHGLSPLNPSLAKVVSTVRLPSEVPAEIKELFKDQPPVTVTTVVGTDNSIRSEMTSPPVSGRLSGDDPYEIQWKGIRGTLTLSPDWNRGTVHFSAPSLSLQDSTGAQLLFDAGDIDGSLHRGSPEGVWLGSNRFILKRFSVTEKDEHGALNESTRADNCLLSAEVIEKDGSLEAVYAVSMDRVKTTGRDFDQAALEIKLSNVDLEALKGLRDRLRDLNKQQPDDDTRRQETLKLVLDLLPRFLARSPELVISRLALGTAEGPIQGDGRVKYVGGQSLERFQLLKDLEGEARLTAPKQLVESVALSVAGIGGKDLDAALGEKAETMKRQLIQEQIDGLLEGGIIVDQGTAYASQVSLKGGVLTLNGKPLELPQGP